MRVPAQAGASFEGLRCWRSAGVSGLGEMGDARLESRAPQWVGLAEWGGAGIGSADVMPTYDYQCEKCDHLFEVFQSMNDAKLTDCPLEDCDGPVRRLLGTGAGLIFKGGGFYETDYRSDSYKQGAKKDKEGSKPESKSESKSSESKPSSSTKSSDSK